MTLSRRDLLKAIFSRDARKGLSISHMGGTLEPGGFVTEIRGLRSSRANANTGELMDAQTRNELVYACLAVKATATHDPRLIVERAKTAGGKTVYEEMPGHPARALMMRPNPQMTESDLMRAAIVSWDVSNPRRFYAEKEYTRGLLTALHPLNPRYMAPLLNRARTEQIGWEWNDGGMRREYAPEEVIVRTAPAWYNPPPLPAALGSVQSDSAQTDYVAAFFEGGGIPPGLLKYHMPLNQRQRDEIRERWASTYNIAAGRNQGIGVIDANVDYQTTGAHMDQLASETLRGVAESRICMVFGVPPLIVYAYVGLLRATYANLKEAWAGFWDATMSPAFKEWRDFWTWHLLSEFEDERDLKAERVRLRYDMSTVAALQEDVDAIQDRARKSFAIGAITLNEARAALGQAADAGGNYYAWPAGRVAIPSGQAPAVAPAAPMKSTKALKDTDATTARLERALTTYLRGEYQAAAAAVRG